MYPSPSVIRVIKSEGMGWADGTWCKLNEKSIQNCIWDVSRNKTIARSWLWFGDSIKACKVSRRYNV
jgi:hypothetical protein